MKKLKQEYRKNGYDYRQVKRNDHAAIYEQYDGNRTVAFEVFRIDSHEDHTRTFTNKETGLKETINVDASENFPGNEKFGVSAWTCMTIERALERFNDIKPVSHE